MLFIRCWSHWHMRFHQNFHFWKEKCCTVVGRLTRTATSSQELITTHKSFIYKFTIIHMLHEQQLAPLLRCSHRMGGAVLQLNKWPPRDGRGACMSCDIKRVVSHSVMAATLNRRAGSWLYATRNIICFLTTQQRPQLVKDPDCAVWETCFRT